MSGLEPRQGSQNNAMRRVESAGFLGDSEGEAHASSSDSDGEGGGHDATQILLNTTRPNAGGIKNSTTMDKPLDSSDRSSGLGEGHK